MSDKITVRIKDKKDIKFKIQYGVRYSLDGWTYWTVEMDKFFGQILKMEENEFMNDRYENIDDDPLNSWSFRSE